MNDLPEHNRHHFQYNEAMSLEYYEDIKLHQKYRSRGYPLTEEAIISFAKVWEPRPYHVDPDFARGTRFGSVIATGNHVISICYRLIYEISCEKAAPTAYIAAMGLDEIRFTNAARPDDILVVELEAISKRESQSDQSAGIVRYSYSMVNQRDEQVLSFKSSALVEKRPKG